MFNLEAYVNIIKMMSRELYSLGHYIENGEGQTILIYKINKK